MDEFKKILKSNSMIALSWGIRNIYYMKNLCTFDVNGFRFSGKVSISEDIVRGIYNVTLCNKDNQKHVIITGLNSINIMDTLDKYIEINSNYENIINKYYINY